MITITTTRSEEARAMAALMGGAPAGVEFRVCLHGREVAASLPLPSAPPGWTAMTLDLKVCDWPGGTG